MTPEWLFYSIYPGLPEALDAAVGELVAPAVARATGVERWFYLRYTDEIGPHIRLRFAGGCEVIDALEAELTPRLGEGLAAFEAGASGHVGCRQDVYEPEYEKFGGAEGVARAERAFEASSALGLAAVTLAGRANRRALGLWLMERTAAEHLERTAGEDLWRYAWWYWSGGKGAAAPARRRAAAETAARPGFVGDAPPRAGVEEAIERYLAAVGEALPADGDPRVRTRLCFHHIHLTANRLGLTIAEEAALGAALCRTHGVAARETSRCT